MRFKLVDFYLICQIFYEYAKKGFSRIKGSYLVTLLRKFLDVLIIDAEMIFSIKYFNTV